MSLMFNRLARNFAKNGYFPTDADTLGRIASAIELSGDKAYLLDPCCGEGLALAALSEALQQDSVTVTFGVEYDANRARAAREVLNTAVHSDIDDMLITKSMGLLFLNPPYGDLVGDKAQLSAQTAGRKRLEKEFFYTSSPWLVTNGILVLIVPHYCVDAEFANAIAKDYVDVSVHLAPTQQYKQCVIIARKAKACAKEREANYQKLLSMQESLPAVLPQQWSLPKYAVPQTREHPRFVATQFCKEDLQFELQGLQDKTLWPQFGMHMAQNADTCNPAPLCALSEWHLELALASAQIAGVLTSEHGRTLLVKGNTYKDKHAAITHEADEDGNLREIRTYTDKFVPCIQAIDFTPEAFYGHLVTIN